MRPWYNVEISTGHAELTATTYLHGWYRIREEGGATDWRAVSSSDLYTEEERAAAWVTLGTATFATPAAPTAALAQITDHPAYEHWEASDGQLTPVGARAEHGKDGRLVLTGPFHRHPEDQDGDHLHSVELLFADIASIREAVAALT